MSEPHDDPDPAGSAPLRALLDDALAVAVGLGVMAVNRVQAVHREVQRRDRSPAGGPNPPTP